MKTVDELSVGDGGTGGGAAEQEAGEIGDAAAAIEAVIPLARVARQMLGADPVEVPLSQLFTLLNRTWTIGSTASAFLPPSWTIE